MCGIAGIVGPEASLSTSERREALTRMCQVIEHRGPDDQGIHIDRGVALGMRRLSVIDLVTGHQPICNEDKSIWIVFNGEIYNFKELRDDLIARGHTFQTNTDTETIVHLYEDEGEQCVAKLRGMFAFAIWDGRERKLFLARDRIGVKPLHYCIVGDTVIFGSEIKSILQHPRLEREVNVEALSNFLTFGYVPDPHTAFSGVEKLPPGHTLTFKDGRKSMRQYWDFDYRDRSAEPARQDRYYIEHLRELLMESVRLRLVSDVPLGAFLSGGIDSSTVVAMMARLMDRPVKTFSIGFAESSFDELQYARIAARHLGTDHHEFIVTPDVCSLIEEIVWHHDEPFADVSSIPTYMVSKMAREHVTVALSGDGGDELFAGYDRYVIDRSREKFELVPRLIRRNLMLPVARALPRAAFGKRFIRNVALEPDARYVDSLSYFDEQHKRELLSPEFIRNIRAHDSSAEFRRLFEVPTSRERIDHLMYLDSKTYLPGDVMTKVDRMSMANSLEAREPLLDHKLIEFVQSIPAAAKLRGPVTKNILKLAVRGLIPDEIIDRPKQGFDVPINHWFKHQLRELVADTLTEPRTRHRGYFNQKAVIALIDEHNRGRRDNARHLWGLLTLELWHRAFIDRAPQLDFKGAKPMHVEQFELEPVALRG